MVWLYFEICGNDIVFLETNSTNFGSRKFQDGEIFVGEVIK